MLARESAAGAAGAVGAEEGSGTEGVADAGCAEGGCADGGCAGAAVLVGGGASLARFSHAAPVEARIVARVTTPQRARADGRGEEWRREWIM